MLALTYKDLVKSLSENGKLITVYNAELPTGFQNLRNYVNVRGIYGFMSYTGDAYVGSSSNLWQRLFTKHKNGPYNNANKHKLFYNHVITHGWNTFNLSIFCTLPDHLVVGKNMNPELSEEELFMLNMLNMYHLTYVEQFYLDICLPSLNAEPLANASSYNLGATGVYRDNEFRANLSKTYINRKYTEATKQLHSNNMLGNSLSSKTRSKMSESYGGVTVLVTNVNTNLVLTFSTKKEASVYLGISVRTITRWSQTDQPHFSPKLNELVRVTLG